MDWDEFARHMAATRDDPTQYRKMMSGEPNYHPDGYIFELQDVGRKTCAEFNAIPAEDVPAQQACLQRVLGKAGPCLVRPPIFWEYGIHIEIGHSTFININCTILDSAPVRIGNKVAIGPNVSLLGSGHPILPEERNVINAENGLMKGVIVVAGEITIEDNCWIGGGAILLSGVTIGQGTMVAAGSVVTKSLPPRVLAAGNPARIIRSF